MTLNIGDNAPGFSLKTKNADGLKDISLSDHKDKQAVVLLFFPFAFTVFALKKLAQ
jgi:peroxiredoxin